jgi:two-component system cell cycle sensor histidine kinase/response regulator CckA
MHIPPSPQGCDGSNVFAPPIHIHTRRRCDDAKGVGVFVENKKTIRAVIRDVMMPVMEGNAAIQALRKIRPNVKIIMVSGLTQNGNANSQTDRHPPTILLKPYTADKLLYALIS